MANNTYKPQPVNPPSWWDPVKAYNEVLDLQGEPWIDGGNMKEVVITPTKDQYLWMERIPKELSEKIWNELREYKYDGKTRNLDFDWENNSTSEMYPYLEDMGHKYLDDKLHTWLEENQSYDWNKEYESYNELADYNYNSTNFDHLPLDKFSRLLNLWKKYPYKTTTDLYNWGGDARTDVRASVRMDNMPIPGKYYDISDIKDFLAELAHPYQRDYGTIPYSYRQRLQQLWDETVYPKEDPRHNRAYDTPGYYEHETHSVVEPMLFDHVFNNALLNFKKLKQNKETDSK